jgi:hypothetical protein
MFLVPLSVCVQVADQPAKRADAAAAKLNAYQVRETPGVIQGAWRLASEPDAPRYRSYLYITLSHYVHLPYDNVYPPFGWPLPSEYGRRLRFNTLSGREWNFLEMGWLLDWREGRMKLLDDVTLEIRSCRSDWNGGSDRQETVETYKRILPRPGPIGWDFSVGETLPPEPLAGKWEAVESNGPGQLLEVEKRFAESINRTVIRFTPRQPWGDASGMSEIVWTGGRFVPWGSGRWWFRTGLGQVQQDALFELGAEGSLRITGTPRGNQPPSTEPPSQPRTYRRID